MKVNIDYYLNDEDVIDPDEVSDIYDYFRESETDDIDKAIEEVDIYDEDGRDSRPNRRPAWCSSSSCLTRRISLLVGWFCWFVGLLAPYSGAEQ